MAASTPAAAGFSAAFAAALLAGCAALPPRAADLAGTNWRVVAINGAPVPAAGDYSMRFDASAGSARASAATIWAAATALPARP